LNRTVAPLVVFVVASIAYVWLGNVVSHVPAHGIDVLARGLTGEWPAFAWILTESCLWPVLVAFGLLAIILAMRAPAWRERAIFSVVTTVVAWQTSDLLKNLFARPRPDYWIVHQETSFSYSSGHAMFAVVVYWLWAWFLVRSELPRAVRFTLAPLAFVWGAGVMWSRLALGAHYVTDVAGGVLLGTALLALAAAVRRALTGRAHPTGP